MVRTASTMLPLGTPLPAFDLTFLSHDELNIDLDSKSLKRITNSELAIKPLLLMVICAHCPFVKHVEEQLTQLDDDYGEQVQILAIASNSLITHPQDSPENLLMQLKKNHWRFPYLLDLKQNLAKSLKAACTPDFFVFSPNKNSQQQLQYRGQLDDSRPGNDIPPTGKDLRAALDAALQGMQVLKDQKPSIGCNIKWHPGEEPDWFG